MHLWVEDFLELFTTVMVAYMFVLLGVVREKVALTVVFLDIILYSFGGVIGTMHHLYFSGEPAEHMALGAFFSAAEVIPLTFLTVEAWSFLQLGAAQQSRSSTPFPHRWAVMFLVAVGLLELPRRRDLRLPDQPADRLLLRDRHRPDRQPRARGDDGRLRDAGDRPGPVLPALPDPGRTLAGEVGADQLLVDQHRARMDVLRNAAAAGHPAALRVGEQRLLRGARAEVPDQRHELADRVAAPAGDILFIAGGAIPTLYIAYLGVRHTVKRVTLEEPEDILFTEVVQPAGVPAMGADEAAAARLK